MGFDNECILNIQSLPGEYFCPVCRTLIYPNEALQAQCTHLYCKPCLAYIVATTQACPYDGYLVTEADSKSLMESNKSLAETIGSVTVHCLYHKSGCQWQGKLSDCITHGATCAYGNSPVVCNRCGTQIVHRQVQEHAQLCPGLQSQTQQADSSLTQSLAVTTQESFQDTSGIASAIPAAAVTTTPSTMPSATTAGAVTASAVATSAAVAATVSTVGVPPFYAATPVAASQGQAVAPQTQTAEQYQQQLQYQYYQQHYPGYNPYMQQYQQYAQFQQYAQPQMQVTPQNVAQGPAQPAPYVQPQGPAQPAPYVQPQAPAQPAPYGQPQALQPSQPQHVLPSQPQNQPQLPQSQVSVAQTQPQQNQPMQSGPQISQMHPQSQIPLQVSHPQAQPIAHSSDPTQVVSQPFPMLPSQTTPSQVQHVQPPPQHQQAVAQHQHPQLQHLPHQPHPQPQVQTNSQIQFQHQPPRQQSFPQPHAYQQHHPIAHAQPQNPPVHIAMGHQSYPQPQPQPSLQMPQGAPLQRPMHVHPQQVVGPHHPAQVRPPQGQFPLQGQQLAMLAPQGTQHTQHQQHVGHHAQRPFMHPSIPSQSSQQGFPVNATFPPQTSQSYPHGMPSSQQQMHSQPYQPHGPPSMQQHNAQTSAGMSSYGAPPQQFQSGPLQDLHGSGQHIGQGPALETHASESGRSENAINAASNTEVSENEKKDPETTATKSMVSQSLSEQNAFGNVGKDAAQSSIAVDGANGLDNGKGKDEFFGQESNLHGSDILGDKESMGSDRSSDREKGGSVRQATLQNMGAVGSFVPPSMGQQHPSGPEKMLPQRMLHPGSMPYMHGQPNQMRPHKHSFPENIRTPMQHLPDGSYQPGMAQGALVPNQNQMLITHSSAMRPIDRMIQPPMGGPLPVQHDTTAPSFAPEHMGRTHPLGILKSNGGGLLGNSRAFHEEGFNTSQEHFRPFAAYPGSRSVSHKDMEQNMKQFPGPTHLDGEGLQRGPRSFEAGLGRPDGFADSLPGRPPFSNQPGPYPVGFPEEFARKTQSNVGRPDLVSPGAEFVHHRIDGAPALRNPGPFPHGMTAGPGGFRKDQLGSGSLPGNAQHDFDTPDFPHTRLHPGDSFVSRNVHGGGEPLEHGQLHGIRPSGYHYHGHINPDDPNLVIDYSQHGFPKETGHFGLGAHLRNGNVGWCRICKFNCGSAEGLDLHVQTREHQQFAMDIILKMKLDVANWQKMNSGGPKSFKKKVGVKGNFRGNKR